MNFTKQFKIGILASLLGLMGCAPTEKLVKLAEETQPKTSMVYVKAIVTVLELTIKDGHFKIEKSTEAIRVTGAGVFISPNGHILTCAHLFQFEWIKGITIEDFNGNVYPAELLAQDDRVDLALLKINEENTNYARIADPRKLRVGQEVIAVGNPLGLSFSVTHGIISALNRDFGDRYNVTQSDTFLNPGNSGGPLFNLKGELVGINSFIVPPVNAPIFTGAGFSVQSGQIVEFLTKYRGLDAALPKFKINYWRTYGRKRPNLENVR